MSSFDDALSAAEKLSTHEQLRLIARLWESVPADRWPPLDDDELATARRQLIDSELPWREPVPWPVVQRLLIDCARSQKGKIYSAPRRFDLATLFVVTLAFSLLFGLLSALGLPPVAMAAAGGFVFLVGAGQAVLFRGQRPRTASIWVGAFLYSVPMLTAMFGMAPAMRMFGGGFFHLGLQALIGGVLGYLAGAMVGAVFLIADVIRGKYRRTATPIELFQRDHFRRDGADRLTPIIDSPLKPDIWKFLFDPRDTSKLFSAPRQIDLATIFVIMAAYSVVFGSLSLFDRLLSLGMQPGMTIMAGGLLTFVALGQAYYFGKANPRGVSVIVGMVWYTLFSIGVSLAFPRAMGNAWFFIVVVNGLIFGAFFGYIAGVLVGGMFMLADVLRRKFARSSRDEEPFSAASLFDDEPKPVPQTTASTPEFER